MAFSNLDLVISMFNRNVFPMAKANIEYIRKQYEGQAVLSQLVEILEKVDIEDQITQNFLQIELSKYSNISDQIRERILTTYERVANYNTTEVNSITESIIKNIATHVIENTYVQYKDDPVAFMTKLREIDISTSEKMTNQEIYSEVKFSGIDTSKMIEELKTSTVKSSLTSINESFPLGGYYPRQLIAIVAPPGGGKSLFLMNECLNFLKQGKRVLYTAIGDLNQYDFVSRMSSVITGTPMTQVAANIDYYYQAALNSEPNLQNLQIQFIAVDSITTSDYISILRKRGYYDDYDIYVIDYDTNFQSENDMYEKGEEIYNAAKILADRPGKLVFIACQPKQAYFYEEIIPMNAMSESSRKDHICDVIITISHIMTPKNANHIGMINIAKNRRGGLFAFPYFRDKNGKFIEINSSGYTWLKSVDQSLTFDNMKSDERFK